jgi:uncharacterized protein (TIGR03382 family)
VTGKNNKGRRVTWTRVTDAKVNFKTQFAMGSYNGGYLDTSAMAPVFSGFLWGSSTLHNVLINGWTRTTAKLGMDINFGGTGQAAPDVSAPGTLALGAFALMALVIRRRKVDVELGVARSTD